MAFPNEILSVHDILTMVYYMINTNGAKLHPGAVGGGRLLIGRASRTVAVVGEERSLIGGAGRTVAVGKERSLIGGSDRTVGGEVADWRSQSHRGRGRGVVPD